MIEAHIYIRSFAISFFWTFYEVTYNYDNIKGDDAMKISISESIRKIRSKNYSFRMFLFFSAFTILIVSSSSFIFLYFQNKNLEREIDVANRALLTQVQMYCDTYFIEKVNSLISEKFLNISQDANIFDFFSEEQLKNTNSFTRVYDNISNSVTYSRFLNSIYIYRKIDDTLVSSREGIVFSATSPDNFIKDLVNIELVKKTMKSEESQNWISPIENSKFWGSVTTDNNSRSLKSIISFAQSIPMFSSVQKRLGCVIVNIDEEYLLKSLRSVFNNNYGELIILDTNGNLIAPSSVAELFGEFKNTKQMKQIFSSNDGFLVSNFDSKLVGMTWMKSPVSNWKYITLVPTKRLNEQIEITKQFTLLITVFLIFISLLGSKVITSHLYRPLKNLTISIKRQFNVNQEEVNELLLIRNVINNLTHKVGEMETTLTKNAGLIEDKIATDILNGTFYSEADIFERLKLVGKDFSKTQFIIIFSEIDKNLFLKLSSDQKEFIIYKLIELTNEFLSLNYECISIRSSTNCIVTIANLNDEDLLIATLKELLLRVLQQLNLSYNVIVSETSETIFNLSKIYSNSINYLKYDFIYGYGNLFTQEVINSFEVNDGTIDLTQIEVLLKSGKIDELKVELSKLSDTIK